MIEFIEECLTYLDDPTEEEGEEPGSPDILKRKS